MSREFTLYLTIIVVSGLLGALCLAIARSERGSPALRFWGCGLLGCTLGFVMILFSSSRLSRVAGFAGNSMLAWVPVLLIRGVLSHTRYHLRDRWIKAAFALIVSVLAYNNFIGTPHLMIDIAAPALVATTLFTIGAILLLRDLPIDARTPSRFLAITLLFAVGVWILQILFLAGVFGGIDDPDSADFIRALFPIALVVIIVAATFALFSIEVSKMERALTQVALSDALTGLPNRRATAERFREETARAMRNQQSFAMLVIDIDHFKRINDNHGHLAGEWMLKHIAETIGKQKRAEDILGRIGGEEFVLLLVDPDIDPMNAAERLREHVATSSFVYGGDTLAATVSGGLAIYPSDGNDWDALFAMADRRLYESKRCGRNRVTGPQVC